MSFSGLIVFETIFPLIGGLAVGIFVRKLMSEALQTMAGSKLKAFLSAITKKRFLGVITGLFVTALIQSSSATTVMIVSFVNAELISLFQAISVIMGANIGTTMTAWIISLFGIKISIATFALPVAFIGMGLIFVNKEKTKNVGQALIGFSILFIGLSFIKDGVPDIKNNPEQLEMLKHIAGSGYLSILIFVLIGTILTVILQSSSATMAVTIVFAMNGWISFEIAAAMVLGENIGTTITATLAAIQAGIQAKRAARAHTVFNIIGVIWMLILFYPFISMINALVPGNPTDSKIIMGFHLSMFHTVFNVINTFVLVWFIKHIEKFVKFLVKDKGEKEPENHLQYINPRVISTPNIGILETRKEIYRMGNIVLETFEHTMALIKDPRANIKLVSSIKANEEITDILQKEITVFVSKIITQLDTEKKANKVRKYFRIVSYLERIADVCESISNILQRKVNQNLVFDEESRNNILKYSEMIYDFMKRTLPLLDVGRKDYYDKKVVLNEAYEIEKSINKQRNMLIKRNLQLINDGVNSPIRGILLNDLIEHLERVGDRIYGLSKILFGRK